jgi:Protein of unknown function (DUF5672)
MTEQTSDNRPELSAVTLVTVTSVALRPTVAALEASMRQARFGRVLLLSDVSPPPGINAAIEWRPITPLVTRTDYSRFILQGLANHIATSHALLIQWDGFVLSGAQWDSRFLDYDYIGAVWPHFGDEHRVGNGGFSLRSKRLLDRCQHLPYDGFSGEDLTICRGFRPLLEEYGIRFAPEDVAKRFSYERTPSAGDEFGFHGIFNLVRLLAPEQRRQLLNDLEPQLLARSEHMEVLRWALGRGDFQLALAILRRLRVARPARRMAR